MHDRKPAASADCFTRFATWSSALIGSCAMFIFAIATIAACLVSASPFRFSNSPQLVVNSWTNIATFLVVFLIQNTQNRKSKAINLKRDELIRRPGPQRDDRHRTPVG